MIRRLALHTACLIFLASYMPHVTASEPQPLESISPPTDLSSEVGTPIPIQSLPSYVQAPQGQLTLYADFDHPRDDGIVLYLVNRTDQNLAFSAQGGDPYVKLEAKTLTGEFERAQTHIHSTCGNSYFYYPTLMSGEFSKFLGYQPKNGVTREVRFRVYLNHAYAVEDGQSGAMLMLKSDKLEKIPILLVSNVGTARAFDDDIKVSRYDDLAVGFSSFDVVRDMATGRAERTPPIDEGTRIYAVNSLDRFPTDETAELLASLLGDEKVREAVVRTLGKLGPLNAKSEAQFQRILNGNDVQNRAVAIAMLAFRPVSEATIAFGKLRLTEKDPVIRSAALCFSNSPQPTRKRSRPLSITQTIPTPRSAG